MKADILFALRSLRRAPLFFFVGVVTLGLGIAANTAIFSLFYQVLLRSLPARDPQQLVFLHNDPPNLPGSRSSDNSESVYSYPLYLRIRNAGGVFQGFAARASTPVQVTAEGAAERGRAEIVSGNYFELLGLRAYLGRLLTPADDSVRGGNPVAVLSYDFWTRRFGSSSGILNRTILINNQPFSIVGVAPENFRGMIAGNSEDLFLPISMRASLTEGWNWYDRPDASWLTIIGRLAPGAARERAAAELQPRFTAIMRDHIDQIKIRNPVARQRLAATRLQLHPAAQGLNSLERQWRKPLYVLLGMVLLLLIIGCANLANLMMARAVNRSREIAIRFALGAGRARVMRLLLAESALLAIAGAACGVALAPVLTRGIIRLMPAEALSGWLSAEVNLPLLAFSAALMLCAAVLFGVLPAVQATRGEASALGERTQTTSGGMVHSRTRKLLVAGQIALSLVLLSAAGLFGRSFANLMRHNPGFRIDHLLTFSIDAGLGGYDGERGLNLYRELNESLAALPGVQDVSYAEAAPLSHSESSTNVSVEGYKPGSDEDMNADTNTVGPRYFRTIGTPLLAGRDFDERDRAGVPKVAVVNQAFVHRFFGGGSAVGKKMEIGAGGPLDLEIVGVVADAQNLNLRETVKPTYYIPYAQSSRPVGRMRGATFLVRARSRLDALPGAARAAVARLDASLPVFGVHTMQVKVQDSIYTDRLIAALAAAFGVLALVLTAVGLYGVIAYLVSRRTAEIGIRMVLGAEPRTILSMILREVGMVVAAGALTGLVAAAAAGRGIESQLFGVPGLDPLVLTVAPALLAAVALAAASIPALRAARVQPLDALRHE